MRPLIVLDAAPFCYGPVSTLMAIVDHIPPDAADLVLLASGTVAEFAAPYGDRFRVIECDTEKLEDLERIAPLLEQCDLFISNTNPPGALFACRRGCPTIYVDTLFWMWDEVDREIAESVLVYAAQDFDGIGENRRRIGSHIRNFRVVGPLISTPPPSFGRRGNRCIVSFGGMESSLTIPGTTNRYPWVMTELLLKALNRVEPFDNVLFCGRGPVMHQLASEFGRPDVEFRFVAHQELIAELQRCSMLLLSPGLTGCFEAAAAGTPTVLLLPQNYSQQLQAATFAADRGWPFAGNDWSRIYPSVSFPRYMPEAEAIAGLNQVIRTFETDADAQERYVNMVVEDMHAAAGRRAGHTMRSGAADVAEMIVQVLAAGPLRSRPHRAAAGAVMERM
ncbi:MAG: hypothetical protein JST22_13830 [Bacteroidetes bacterium]|nr:hypothetical protein [Bacteroidota bacterium]